MGAVLARLTTAHLFTLMMTTALRRGLFNRLADQLPAAANGAFKDSEAVVKHGPGSYPFVFAVALLGHSH